VKTHTITIFDRAFNASSACFGAGTRTASPSTFVVATIGHDRRKMRSAMVEDRQGDPKDFASFGNQAW
jgi:hypothetical protein